MSGLRPNRGWKLVEGASMSECSDRWRATGDQKPRGEMDERGDMEVKRSRVDGSKPQAFHGRMGQAPLDSPCVAQSGVSDCAFCAFSYVGRESIRNHRERPDPFLNVRAFDWKLRICQIWHSVRRLKRAVELHALQEA